jgi:RHS repeat-associated protein
MWDEETDLLYLRARYYEPETGRFLSRDTYEGELGNPLSRHLYAYVQNNPVNRIDPSGRMPVWMLNTISWGYNNRAFFGDWDASLAVFLGNVIDPGRHTSLYVPFHEIAQINIARYLHNLTGGKNEIILEKSIGTGEYYKRFGVIKTEKLYEADIVMGRQVWEVKPISGKDPKPQLELYKKKGGLTPSNILVGHTISGITVFDELKMKITFPRPGEARYELYFDSGNGTIETITTVAAAKWLIKLLPKLIGSGGRRLMPVR